MASVDKNSVKLLSLQHKPQSVPPWVDAARQMLENPTLLSPLTSKEAQPAGFTCERCPQPNRPSTYFVASTCTDTGTGHSTVNCQCDKRVEYTVRCKSCSKQMRRWSRARTLGKDIEFCALANDVGIRFVTLTVPNYQDYSEGLRDLKKKVRNFRHSKDYKEKVIGSCDFYEWTEASDGSYNVHLHAIWLGQFWKQADLLDSWKHGGARIELVKRKMKNSKVEYQEPINRVTKYIVNYVKKMDTQGIRCQQRTGVLYG